jgi:GPI mannosyltransferase 3
VERNRPGLAQRGAIFYWSLLVLAGAAALRAWLAWYDHSVFWPDEIHQSLEQAHRAVFGYGFLSWEFRDGARNWLFPGSIAGLWKVASLLGVDSSIALITLARLVLVTSSVAAIWWAAKLASASGGARAALAAIVALAAFPPSVAFAYRAMSETASAPLIVLGAWCLSKNTSRGAMLAGLSIGAACLLRYQNVLFAFIFAAALLLQRQWRQAFALCGLGAVIAMLGGLLDWVTWGRPFHSLIAYIDFNLVMGGASTFGVEPFSFYATSMWSSVGPLLPVLVAFFCIGAYFAPVLGAAVLAYVLAHSVLPHKEFRFLVPCLPLFATVVGIGVERVLRRVPFPRIAGAAASVGVTLAFGFGLLHLTYADMGQYTGTDRATLSVWKSEEEATLLLADAGTRDDLCGIAVLGARAAFTGGYTYLHRDVPLIYESELCSAAPANYVISQIQRSSSALPGAYNLELQRGAWGLFRREGTCKGKRAADDALLEGARDMGLVRAKANQAPDGSVRFDLQRDSGSFVKGWGNGELLDCDVARWAVGKSSFVDFDFTPTGPQFQLNLRARAHELATPQRFAIAVNGQRLHVGPMSVQLKTYSVDIPDQALRAGRNRIEFAFGHTARESSDDTRELAALFRELELVPKQDEFTVDVALKESRRHLMSGFNPPEQAGDITFAWSEGMVSEIHGTLAWPRSPHVLQVVAEAFPLVASQRMRVFANDTFVGTLNVPAKWATQRLVVPANALAKGKNRIRFEYEAAASPSKVSRKLTDHRVLAVRFRRIELAPMVAPSELDVGTVEAREFLLDGWSSNEHDGARSVVWSAGPRATAVLSLKGLKKPVLHLSAQGYSQALPINVTVSLNGEKVGIFAAPDGWQDISVPLPTREHDTDGEIVAFEFDRTARPSDMNPQSDDNRDLALRVDRLWVESEAEQQTVGASIRTLTSGTVPKPVRVTTTALELRQ